MACWNVRKESRNWSWIDQSKWRYVLAQKVGKGLDYFLDPRYEACLRSRTRHQHGVKSHPTVLPYEDQ
jgi:hypothetical protein